MGGLSAGMDSRWKDESLSEGAPFLGVTSGYTGGSLCWGGASPVGGSLCWEGASPVGGLSWSVDS